MLHQQTNYPWDGTIRIEFELEEPADFGLNLRIPGWCAAASLTIAGEELPLDVRKGYTRITRLWQHSESLVLHLDMPAERVYAHPSVRDDADHVALRCGPLIYCLESADNPVPLHQIRLPEDAPLEKHFDSDLLGGTMLIKSRGFALETADWSETLYRSSRPAYRPYTLTAIPYYAWDHREPGEMRVWIGI